MAKNEPWQNRNSAKRAAVAWVLTVGLLLTGFFSAFGHAGHDMRSPAARAAALIGFGASTETTPVPYQAWLEQPLCQTSSHEGHAHENSTGDGHHGAHHAHAGAVPASPLPSTPSTPDPDFARPCPGGVCTMSPVALQAPVAVVVPSAAAAAITAALPQDINPPAFATPGQNAGPRAPPAR